MKEWHVDVRNWPPPGTVISGVSVEALADEAQASRSYLTDLTEFWNSSGSITTRVRQYTVEEVAARLARSDVVPLSYFIARQNSRIAGVLSVRRPLDLAPSKADFSFAILDTAKGLGVEQALLSRAIEYGRANGLFTLTANRRGDDDHGSFLESLGLQPSIELIVLEKDLTSAITSGERLT